MTKIHIETKSPAEIVFSEVEPGSFFRNNGKIYRKVDQRGTITGSYFAEDFSTGKIVKWENDVIVTPIRSVTLVVEF